MRLLRKEREVEDVGLDKVLEEVCAEGQVRHQPAAGERDLSQGRHVIDLGEPVSISFLSASFFHNAGVWIFMPVRVEYSISEDGEDFRLLASIKNETSQKKEGPFIKEFPFNFEDTTARYVKVLAKSIGVCPEWHAGAGAAAWLFADEIVVE